MDKIQTTLKKEDIEAIIKEDGEIDTVIPKDIPVILTYPHASLETVCEPVDFKKDSREDLQKICENLNLALQMTLYGQKLGLAAPQIGVNKRLFIAFGIVFINPEIKTTKVPQMITSDEGCYSCPGKLYRVTKVKYFWATWYNIDGQKHEAKLKGLEAVVFMHELNHLNGLCCADIGTEVVIK